MAGNDQNKEDRPVSDWPNMDPRWWMLAAVTATFGLAIPGAIFAAVAVFSQKLPGTAHEMMTVLVPFGTIILALITFFTVVWRGLLTDQQVKEQRRQNDAKDDEMLAKLLVDGAGLLGDENEAKRLAGVSALKTVATAPSDRYASNAMDILLNLLKERYAKNPMAGSITLALSAMNVAAHLQRKATISVELDGNPEGSAPLPWPAINGAKSVILSGGIMYGRTLDKISNLEGYAFLGTTFNKCEFQRDLPRTHKCLFIRCRFNRISKEILRSDFRECDFSGAIVDIPGPNTALFLSTIDLHRGHNYFYDDNPPQVAGQIDWAVILNARPASQREQQRPQWSRGIHHATSPPARTEAANRL